MLNALDRGWQKIVNFAIGDTVEFSVPYFEGKFEYVGVVLEVKSNHAVVEYYEPLHDTNIKTHVSLVDEHGYRRLTKQVNPS
jgi:hypothetical protein